MDKKATIELLKSTGRFIWFGLLGVIVTALTALMTNGAVLAASVEILGTAVNVGALLVLLIGAAIKALDRYIHVNKSIASNGLAPAVLQN